MVSIYVSKEVKEKLYKFIRSSRISPEFGSPNRFKSPNEAVEFLLDIGFIKPLSSLEKIVNQPFVQFSMRMSDEKFDKIEKSGELRKIISEKFKRAEEGTGENEG